MIKNISSFIRNRAVLALGFLYATNGLLLGIFFSALPGIKHRLGFDDGSLGLSLFLSPVGAITGMLFSTKIFSKIPAGKWMSAGYMALCFLMMVQVNSPNRIVFWCCLYCYGLISFLNGVSVNTTVNKMEREQGKLFMSTCHGMYSLGGAVSTGLAAAFFSFHLASGWQIVILAITILFVLLGNRKYLLLHSELIHSRSGLQLPSFTILGISFICLVTFMAEGCVADWSAIYLKEVMHSPAAFIGLGYTGFAIAMTLGRLNGDTIISRVGGRRIVIFGSLLAATGFTLVVFAPYIFVVIAGYILVGLGCSCIVPVLFTASANIPGVSMVEGYAMVTTGGLIGFLTGPSVIGFISKNSGLPKALSLLIFMALLASFAAWRNKFLVNVKRAEPELEYDEQIY
jgi:MFS family permease